MVQYTLMSQGTTPVRTITKDILARCMATENIRVEHRADAPTAYFDTKNRVLGLPVWKDMDSSIYDMLVGHEVSHALHTPAEGWQDFVGKGKQSGVRHMFVNVVEDARIERLIKDKFPGLRRDFSSAYKSLFERDLFELKGKKIADLPFIDRLNLEFKLGLFGLVEVPFSDEEKPYVTRMADTTTFEDVVELARELYEQYKDEQPEEDESGEPQASPEAGDGEGEGEGSGSTLSDSDESGEGSSTSQSTDGDDDDDTEGQNGSGSDSDGDDDSNEDSGASSDDDTDDGDSSDSTDGDGDSDDAPLDYDDYKSNVDCAGSTQRNYEKGVEDMRDDSASAWKYSTLPNVNIKDIVISPSKIAGLWDGMRTHSELQDRWNSERCQNQLVENRQSLRDFQNSIKNTVNQMVQQFQMKQAADADKRTDIAKTGILDTVSMINYRWSEDIFVKNEVHTDGKNHGIIMYLDWSGSMGNIIEDTVKQLLVLVEFCKKVNVPFEVYAFSSNEYNPVEDRYGKEWDKWREDNPRNFSSKNTEQDCGYHEMQLYNFLSSKLNKREWTEALFNFWNLTLTSGYYGGNIPTPRCLSLGCTPLNEAVICAMQQVPDFQRQYGVQIVNAVFLSDGDGHRLGIGGYYRYNDKGGKDILRDTKTGREYILPRKDNAETDTLMTMLKNRTGCNTIGIRLHGGKNIKNLRWNYWDTDESFATACKQYKKENFATSTTTGYDEQFIIKGNTELVTDAMDDLGNDASYARIKNAFIKGGNTKKSSRVIANRLIDIIAV